MNFLLAFLCAASLVLPPREETGLVVDAADQTQWARAGQESARFLYHVSNISAAPITINQVRTSCGCTVATLPSKPWTLAPGAGGVITLTVDLRGKAGTLRKTATIDTMAGYRHLSVTVEIPMTAALRLQNQKLAAIDRQLVFKSDCANCHAAPAEGKFGRDLYAAACGICHDARNRASMVPDLRAIALPRDRTAWITLIEQGKPASLMPAFARSQGGPLTPEQVGSLADYLVSLQAQIRR